LTASLGKNIPQTHKLYFPFMIFYAWFASAIGNLKMVAWETQMLWPRVTLRYSIAAWKK